LVERLREREQRRRSTGIFFSMTYKKTQNGRNVDKQPREKGPSRKEGGWRGSSLDGGSFLGNRGVRELFLFAAGSEDDLFEGRGPFDGFLLCPELAQHSEHEAGDHSDDDPVEPCKCHHGAEAAADE